ncbi:aldehyde dehydrogenase [Xylaria cf. heliscus]|nr:aldehyde dehydrogenase [Xylaria cf. heliscus]
MADSGKTNSPLDIKTFYNVINGVTIGTPGSRLLPLSHFSTPEDVDRAVEAGKRAANNWRAVPWDERADALRKFAGAIEAATKDFAELVMMEQCKPGSIRDFCRMSIAVEIIEDKLDRKVATRYLPLGVTVVIVPQNLSPSPYTPYCSLKLAELGLRFFPAGILQALSGDNDLGHWLIEHPDVKMVSFTGSTAVGKQIMKTCSKTFKRFTLELGGNDAAIICADVNPIAVAAKIKLYAFCNSGYICIAIKRVYVHESVYDIVLETPYERVKVLLADIKNAQLKVAAGTPTIIDNPPDDSRIVVEEQFGPVLPLMKWSEEDDVIRSANATESGLGASVWTRDKSQADHIARRLQAGNVWINCHAEMQPSTPFSGHKRSGMGTEMGVDGLKCCCSIQSIYTRPA